MSTQPSQMGYPAGSSLGATPTARKSWFSRNWKWLVPVILIVVCGLPLALMGAVFAAMKNSDAAKESVFQAQTNSQVVNQLGTPIAAGWLVTGSINTSTTSGDADLAIPISGPKGHAKIYVTAHKVAGAWNYSVMEVAIAGSNERINLLAGDATAPSAPVPSDAAAPRTTPVQPTTAVSQPVTNAEPPAPAIAALPTSEQAGVIQTQETNSGGMVGELTECRRHEGVLTIKVRFRSTSNKRVSLKLTEWNNGGDFEKFYVTAGNKKFFILKDTEGVYLTSLSASNGVVLQLDPGDTSLWWAKYPSPPVDVKKINFVTPVTPPFEDIPITDK
jgi:Cytochrome oxidase complex assembly protein 1